MVQLRLAVLKLIKVVLILLTCCTRILKVKLTNKKNYKILP